MDPREGRVARAGTRVRGDGARRLCESPGAPARRPERGLRVEEVHGEIGRRERRETIRTCRVPALSHLPCVTFRPVAARKCTVLIGFFLGFHGAALGCAK